MGVDDYSFAVPESSPSDDMMAAQINITRSLVNPAFHTRSSTHQIWGCVARRGHPGDERRLRQAMIPMGSDLVTKTACGAINHALLITLVRFNQRGMQNRYALEFRPNDGRLLSYRYAWNCDPETCFLMDTAEQTLIAKLAEKCLCRS